MAVINGDNGAAVAKRDGNPCGIPASARQSSVFQCRCDRLESKEGAGIMRSSGRRREAVFHLRRFFSRFFFMAFVFHLIGSSQFMICEYEAFYGNI